MHYGFVLPSGDARQAAELASELEAAGWDGFFVWEPVWGVDAWISLTAAAMVTERIRLGTMLTPVSRRRPWKLAGETATLDRLSGGRVVLSVGLGALDSGFEDFGEVTDRRLRAELLDEGLDIVTGLWRGQPFRYEGRHYQVKETSFPAPAPPVQQPRIPIWVVGSWPSERSMARALRYDGLIPSVRGTDGMRQPDADELAEIVAAVGADRPDGRPFDVVVEGETPGDRPKEAAAIVAPYERAGATWWLEARWGDDHDRVRARAEQGPPRPS